VVDGLCVELLNKVGSGSGIGEGGVTLRATHGYKVAALAEVVTGGKGVYFRGGDACGARRRYTGAVRPPR
jgi:hypothetical protein